MESPFDRMTLAERIAAETEQEPLTPAQMAELERRLADYRAHPETSIPWELAREQMRR